LIILKNRPVLRAVAIFLFTPDQATLAWVAQEAPEKNNADQV
jgi:hypothetical protein